MFCILFDSFIKQISQHSSAEKVFFLKCSSSWEISFPFGYIVGLDEDQFQNSFLLNERIERGEESPGASHTDCGQAQIFT